MFSNKSQGYNIFGVLRNFKAQGYALAFPSANHCTPRSSPQEKNLGNEEAHIHLVLCPFNLSPEAEQYRSMTLKAQSKFSG